MKDITIFSCVEGDTYVVFDNGTKEFLSWDTDDMDAINSALQKIGINLIWREYDCKVLANEVESSPTFDDYSVYADKFENDPYNEE